jgi:TRAP-type C4-dicarboxylate transport system permease small subunit
MDKPKSKSQLLMGLFLLGCVLFNYPILTLFNRRTTLFGIPLLYLYLFIVWATIIVAIMLITKARKKATRSKRNHGELTATALDRLR